MQLLTVDSKRVLLHKLLLANGWSEAFAGVAVVGADAANIDSLLEIILAGETIVPDELRGQVHMFRLERAETLTSGEILNGC